MQVSCAPQANACCLLLAYCVQVITEHRDLKKDKIRQIHGADREATPTGSKPHQPYMQVTSCGCSASAVKSAVLHCQRQLLLFPAVMLQHHARFTATYWAFGR